MPTQVSNIQRRGREYEAGIRLDYLSKLNEKYEHWIADYKEGRLLIIDKDKVNFADDPSDLNQVIELIDKEMKALV